MEHLEDHLAYQQKIQDEGIMFGAGPFPDDEVANWEEAMVIIRADSLEAAEEIAANDPMHESGARSYRVRLADERGQNDYRTHVLRQKYEGDIGR